MSEHIEAVGAKTGDAARSNPGPVAEVFRKLGIFGADCTSRLFSQRARSAAKLDRGAGYADLIAQCRSWYQSAQPAEEAGELAVIELAANGSRRVFERRRVDAGNVTLPWIE